jgi:transcriptional regulator with XRE-family HTH domain
MKDRLQRFLELEQLSPAKLADILGIQRSGLSHILSGRNKPGFDLIQKMLIKFPSLNADWLITGKGKVYKESSLLAETKVSPTLFASSENSSEHEIPEVPQLNTDYKSDNSNIIDSKPYENEINQNLLSNDREKPILKRVIMIYSNNTFTEYLPGENN